jgi:hypothetical protein
MSQRQRPFQAAAANYSQPPLDKRDSHADYADPLAPNEPGLPLFTHRTGGPMSAVEVIDSSSSRRRAVEGQALSAAPVDKFELPEDEGDDSKGHKKDQSAWPTTGIGMEEQIPGVVEPSGRKEFKAGAYDDDDKWAKGKQRQQQLSWVSSPKLGEATRRSAPQSAADPFRRLARSFAGWSF